VQRRDMHAGHCWVGTRMQRLCLPGAWETQLSCTPLQRPPCRQAAVPGVQAAGGAAAGGSSRRLGPGPAGDCPLAQAQLAASPAPIAASWLPARVLGAPDGLGACFPQQQEGRRPHPALPMTAATPDLAPGREVAPPGAQPMARRSPRAYLALLSLSSKFLSVRITTSFSSTSPSAAAPRASSPTTRRLSRTRDRMLSKLRGWNRADRRAQPSLGVLATHATRRL